MWYHWNHEGVQDPSSLPRRHPDFSSLPFSFAGPLEGLPRFDPVVGWFSNNVRKQTLHSSKQEKK